MGRTVDDDVNRRADPALETLFRAETEAQKEAAIEQILQQAEPVIRRVLLTKIRPADDDADEIRGEVLLALVTRLQDIRAGNAEPIASFADYTASVTVHAFNHLMRRRYPERARLKNRLRYLLTHDAHFAMWTGSSREMVCGLALWRGSTNAADAETFVDIRKLPYAARDSRRPAAAIAAVFETAGRSLELESLVNIVARLWNVHETIEPAHPEREFAADQVSARDAMEARELVVRLWQEIAALNERQRAAILWNLRDARGRSALPLVLISGAATLDGIAAALATTRQEMLDIWDELPLDDLRIASMLHVSRQQVINLRKSARERLGRRLKHFS